VQKNGNEVNVSLPAMSVASVLLKGTQGEVITALGDEGNHSTVLDVYPAPAPGASMLKLSVNKTGNAVIGLLDVNGRLLSRIYAGRIKTVPFTKDIETSSLPKGLYFIHLKLDDKIIVRKFAY
jgi:hypothetical protein